MLDSHHHYCVCDDCIRCVQAARENQSPFSWKAYIASMILLNVVMWYLTTGQYSESWWGLW